MTIQDLINELNALGSIITQYVTGTWEQYNALQEKDEGTLYHITDKNVIYKGNTCYSGVQNVVCVKPQGESSENDKITVTFTLADGTEESIEIVPHAAMHQHIDKKGSNTVSGHVKLSDATDSQSDTNQGTAATPKAVSEALRLAKEYAEETMAVQGSFEVLKGYITANGIIESAEDTDINGVNINSLTGYEKGWAFFVKAAGHYVGEDCEINDKIICMNDYSGSFKASDFIVLQANIDGAVTSTEQLTEDTLILGNGGHSIKTLDNGADKQVMTMVEGKPQWSDNVDTTYTFAGGTDGSFNVTPKGGQAQKVNIGKPSNAGHADTATEATLAKNADNAGEAIHSETADLAYDLGGKPETHEENFVYQPTAADLSIKDGFADIKKLKGNTVVWNQLFKDSHNPLPYETAYVTRSGGSNFKEGHKFLVSLRYNCQDTYTPNSAQIMAVKDGSFYGDQTTINVKKGENSAKVILTSLNDSNTDVCLRYNWLTMPLNSLTIVEDSVSVIDLTQMFGEGNEPATVEEFEAMFPNDYYEYNEGELMSFDGKGLKSVGFNQWDEEWELGAYDISNGNKIQQDTYLRNVNPIKILGGTDYFFKSPTSLFLCWYDSEMKFINSVSVNNSIIKSPSNAAYLNFYQYNKNTYDNDICINLSHSGYRDGEYEPYEDYTLQLQDGKTISQLTGKLNGEGESVTIFPYGLRSAGEAYDEIVYDEATGKHKAIKRIGSVDMGTLSWYVASGKVFYTDGFLSGNYSKDVSLKTNLTTTKYITKHDFQYNNSISAREFTYDNALIKRIWIKDESYADIYAFRPSLAGQILYYELAEPEVYELDNPINTSYEAYDFGTEEVIYSEDSEVNIPMKASIEYGFNAVDMIRGNYFDIQKLKKGYLPNGGIAASAEKLATPRSFKISGGAESEAVEFDGTDDVDLNVTKVKSSVIDWEGVTNITDKNIVNAINYTSPSKTNIPNEYAVVEAVMGIIDLLTWKTL